MLGTYLRIQAFDGAHIDLAVAFPLNAAAPEARRFPFIKEIGFRGKCN